MNSKDIVRLSEKLNSTNTFLDEKLRPRLVEGLQQLFENFKKKSYISWYGSIPSDLYQEVISNIQTLKQNNIDKRLYRNYIPVLLTKPHYNNDVIKLWRFTQLKWQVDQYIVKNQKHIDEVERALWYIQHNDLGMVVNLFQNSEKRRDFKKYEQYVEGNLDFINSYFSQVALWTEQIKGNKPIQNTIKKTDKEYLTQIYSYQHPFSERMLDQPNTFLEWCLEQALELQRNIKSSGYSHYHEQMTLLWQKLKREQAGKDIDNFSLELLRVGQKSISNIDQLINDNLKLTEIAAFRPQDLKEQYQIPLKDAEVIVNTIQQTITRLKKEAVPKFNSETISDTKLQFLSLLKYCNSYSKFEREKESEALKLISLLQESYQKIIEISPTNYKANFLSASEYKLWLREHQNFYIIGTKLVSIGHLTSLFTFPEGDLNKVKADFIENGALYFTLIERLSGQSKQYTTARLPKAIVEQVRKFPLITKDLKVKMRNYQDFGVKYILSYRNVLLGDEMGLGKTIQAIAVINHLYQIGERYSIVVCPLSILENWYMEIKKWSKLTAFTYRGSKRETQYDAWLKKGGVLLTNYEQCQRLLKKKNKPNLDLLIVDEAHYVKNPETKRSKNISALAATSDYKLFMSGTPLENNLTEMMQLIKIVNPVLYKQIKKEKNGLTGLISVDRFKDMIATVYLRRKRSEVLKELPKLSIIDRWSTFNAREYKFYTSLVGEGIGALSIMRRTAFIDEESEKISQIREICKEAKSLNRKVIVFSYYKTHVLFFLAKLLPTCMDQVLSGDLSPTGRQKLIEKFNESKTNNVLLSQIEAGGVGLNIQSANIVIICEPQWKPSTEKQAISRVYRMGQTKDVIVYRLLTRESIDEAINDLIDSKQLIFDSYANDSAIEEAFKSLQKKKLGTTGIKKKIFSMEKKRILGDSQKKGNNKK